MMLIQERDEFASSSRRLMLADWIQTKCSLRFQVNLENSTCKKRPKIPGCKLPTRCFFPIQSYHLALPKHTKTMDQDSVVSGKDTLYFTHQLYQCNDRGEAQLFDANSCSERTYCKHLQQIMFPRDQVIVVPINGRCTCSFHFFCILTHKNNSLWLWFAMVGV